MLESNVATDTWKLEEDSAAAPPSSPCNFEASSFLLMMQPEKWLTSKVEKNNFLEI